MKNTNYKGIVLAGGKGTRLYPVTKVVSKQLLPIYNKPMIYYPLSTLINASVKDIMIITSAKDQHLFKRLLGNGSQWNVHFEYLVQEKPEGIAQSLIIAKNWLNDSSVVLILGDNLFFGPNLFQLISKSIEENNGATLFSCKVSNPERYGVVEFDQYQNVLSIEEKPKKTKSKWIITGLYIYNNCAVKYAQNLDKSERGEYEITDLNKIYLKEKNLKVILMNEKYSWLDTGTHETLLEASSFVKSIESNSTQKVANLKII
jgi:glucose-1-phosphate thymidylyltransferase